MGKHWHPEFPERGQALREIVCDIENNYVDSILIDAAFRSGFNFVNCYSRKGIRMWVDPGELKFVLLPILIESVYYINNKVVLILQNLFLIILLFIKIILLELFIMEIILQCTIIIIIMTTKCTMIPHNIMITNNKTIMIINTILYNILFQ